MFCIICKKGFDWKTGIIDNIHIISSNSNVKMTYIIGGMEYDKINTFLSIAAQYHEFKLKLIFTDPKVEDKISICYRNYLINSDLRKNLLEQINKETRKYIIKTDTHVYNSGMCTRI